MYKIQVIGDFAPFTFDSVSFHFKNFDRKEILSDISEILYEEFYKVSQIFLTKNGEENSTNVTEEFADHYCYINGLEGLYYDDGSKKHIPIFVKDSDRYDNFCEKVERELQEMREEEASLYRQWCASR